MRDRACTAAVAAVAAMVVFATAAFAAAPSVTAVNGHLALNGTPFIPVMAQTRYGCPARPLVDEFATLGVNVLYNDNAVCDGDFSPGQPTAAQKLDSSLAGRTPPMWFWTSSPSGQQQLAGASTLLNWQPPLVRALDVNWMLDKCKGQSTLPFYKTVSAKAHAGGIVSAYVLAGSISDQRYSNFNCVTQPRMAVAVWTALVAGASAIDYITIDPRNATIGNGFNVTPAAAASAASLSKDVARSAQMLLAAPMSARSSNGVVKVAARRYSGSTYLFVVNTQNSAERTAVTVAGGWHGVASLLKGSGRPRSQGGALQVQLGPFAVDVVKLR